MCKTWLFGHAYFAKLIDWDKIVSASASKSRHLTQCNMVLAATEVLM